MSSVKVSNSVNRPPIRLEVKFGKSGTKGKYLQFDGIEARLSLGCRNIFAI